MGIKLLPAVDEPLVFLPTGRRTFNVALINILRFVTGLKEKCHVWGLELLPLLKLKMQKVK